MSSNCQSIKIGEYTFVGVSTAGIGTSIVVPELSICFDTAQGLPHAYFVKNYLVTHAHMDHAGGIPYILSQKALMHTDCGQFFMPKYMIDPMTKIMDTWSTIEGYKCPYKFVPTELGVATPLEKNYYFKAFQTCHRVQSNGYTIYKKHKRLKEELRGQPREKIREMAMKGEDVNEVVELNEISFTGDTLIDFVDVSPEAAKSKVLIVECTYAGERKTIEKARQWGHIHFDEIVARLDDITAENILLIHLSGGVSFKELEAEVNKLPDHHQKRFHLFPRI